ncbi:MAG: DSD1 family PLP-dependent enzyme, partial [Pseudomonadota bacterium]|nr:DSD1 family PLP-dependent enzyme [Pseudomonadota bacterium]
LADVDTPSLIVDLDAFEENLATMGDAVRKKKARLRPHAKSHKCPDIAKLQIAQGAVGICCQKVGEAEAFVAAGITDVLITNEIVGTRKLGRVAALARSAKIGVLVDDFGNVSAIAEAASHAGSTLEVLVEIDVGAHRCGVAPGAPALELARVVSARAASGLRFGGLHAYQGTAQHLRRPAERRAAIARAVEGARETRALIESAGIACPTVTGAGTGTFLLEANSGVYTELQPGSYVFMDADYGRNTLDAGEPTFAQSLYLWSTVMSVPAPDRAIVDAGLKAFSVDSGMPLCADRPELECTKASDEHGVLKVPVGAQRLRVGDKLRLIPGHCDPTVNLHDTLVGVRNGRVECIWPVSARGALL